jgi:hypothetical protein
MKINIKERSQKVLQFVADNMHKSLRAIAKATSIPKSSVQRHLKAAGRKQNYAESYFWETAAGEEWLKLLVFAVVYHFGIKKGVGAASLSEFLQVLRLGEVLGCSTSAIRELEVKLSEAIIVYGQEQTTQLQQEKPIAICVGADETFFGLPILVAIELSSGFILSEEISENRTYETWWQEVRKWFNSEQWDCRGLVSDGARAIIKLATNDLGCDSIPDLFHLMRALSKPMGSALARQQARLQKQEESLKSSVPSLELVTQISDLQAQQQIVITDKRDYQNVLHNISLSVHPFNIHTGEAQLCMDVPTQLQADIPIWQRLCQLYAPSLSLVALERWQRQLLDLSKATNAWWTWVSLVLALESPGLETQQWILTSLLPWVYWCQQTDKTRHPELKQTYLQASQSAHVLLLAHPHTQTLSTPEHQHWVAWASWMCAKFQRTSSAVEGRNGYLSGLHHANRGFTQQRLQVLTTIHNFDLRRDDGTTAAQRLLGKPFPDLFSSVLSQMGQLPRTRLSKKNRRSGTIALHTVPA